MQCCPKKSLAGASKPSWLSDRGSLAATLPSRRGMGALNQEDEAGRCWIWGEALFSDLAKDWLIDSDR